MADGKIDIETIPMIGIFFDTINMAVNLSTISGYYTGPLNIPSTLGGGHWSDFFSYVGLRQFLVNSFPYEQDIRQVLSVDGIPFGLNYGGAIPHFMDDYYAYNVTWPDGQPNFNVSQVGGAAWWWAQVNNASSPYYDPNLIGCTVATPCVFPVEGQSADTLQNGQYPIWGPYITALSGGRLVIQEVDLAFQPIPCEFFCPPGPYQNPLTFNVLGWLPDYPDPTDYTVPLYAPDATYTAPDSVNEVLTQDESPSCPDQSDNLGKPCWLGEHGRCAAGLPGVGLCSAKLGRCSGRIPPHRCRAHPLLQRGFSHRERIGTLPVPVPAARCWKLRTVDQPRFPRPECLFGR